MLSHKRGKLMHWLHTGGILILLNSAFIVWYTKQNNSETSSFGSEFVALKVVTKMLGGLCYKLCMMGIPTLGPSSIHCDNNSVANNSSLPASTLKKKSNSIAYHCVPEIVATNKHYVTYESIYTHKVGRSTYQTAAWWNVAWLSHQPKPSRHYTCCGSIGIVPFVGFAFVRFPLWSTTTSLVNPTANMHYPSSSAMPFIPFKLEGTDEMTCFCLLTVHWVVMDGSRYDVRTV
jgi:hypothetical protein